MSLSNSALTMLYPQIGKRINAEILEGKRADYGKQILHTLCAKLILEFGKGFSTKSLRHINRFAGGFSGFSIVSSLPRQLSRPRVILCAGKNDEQAGLLAPAQSVIHVAEYLTILPSRKVLRKKLRQAIEDRRGRLENNRLTMEKGDA